jgi:hypothetical protein
MNKQHKLVRLFLGPLFVFCLLPALSNASTIKLDANDSLTATGAWQNIANCYADDGLYTVGTGLANGTRYFRVGLSDPADTMNQRITSVVLYAKGYSNNARAKVRLIPYFNNTAGISSASYAFGVTEATKSYDITGQRVPWAWSDVVNLSVQFTPRTAATFSVNHIFAVITSVDTINLFQEHYFLFDPIASPETLGLYFPVVISARTVPGDTVMSSYNNTASLTDLTGATTPNIVTFTAGFCSVQVMIAQDTVNTMLLVSDGDTSGSSNQFDVINPGLHHFGFDSVGAQTAGVAFPVSIAALDFYGDTVATFAEKADLWDLSGTLTPDSSGAFVSGTWAGNLTIATAVPFDTLYCSRTVGGRTFYGTSNGFTFFLGVGGEKPVPAAPGFCRLDVSPNPLYQRAEFSVYSPKAGQARIIVYNLLGQKAAQKDLGAINPGTVKLNWDIGTALPQGVYFASLQIDGESASFKKLVILK